MINKLDFKAGFRTLVLPAAAACCTLSCKENTPEIPPVTLDNQIEYNGGTPVNILSAVSRTAEDGSTTFYLSPSKDLVSVDQMLQADDFLCITVTGADGAVDVGKETFAISYSSFILTQDNVADAESISLSVAYDAEASDLSVALDVMMADGTSLRADYDGVCTETPEEVVPVENEFDLDGERTPILSVVEWYDYKSSSTSYHFYSKADMVAPENGVKELLVTVADGQSTEVDLSTVDSKSLSIVCGDFSNASATTGTISITKDKFTGNILLSLKAESAGKVLEADYEGVFTRGFESINVFSVKSGDVTEDADLTKMFLYRDPATNVFAMGLKQDAQEPAGLMEGMYAVQFNVATTSFGQTLTLPDDAEKCSFRLFDYVNYASWDINMASGKGATGTVYVEEEGNRIFVSFSVAFPDGTVTEGEWFGPATVVEENFDLTPVRPFTPHITITSPEGEVLKEWTVGQMELRLEKNFSLRGGDPQYGGAVFDAYVMYFRPEGNTAGVEDIIEIPQFMFRADKIPTDGTIDLAAAADLNWYIKFQRSELRVVEYSENYSMFGMTYYKCPDYAKVNISRNEDKTWDFSFELIDYGSYSSSNPSLKDGTKNKIVIEWKGAATKYTGSKKNDMQDSDY